jgi:monovalent cation:H+ antiporter-2, CPA2 family
MAMLSWRLKQPLIVGYIGAGMIIGPHIPPFSLILNLDVLNLFAEIGIVLLLFVVGMEFPIALDAFLRLSIQVIPARLTNS